MTGVNRRTDYTDGVREQTPPVWSRVFRPISCSSAAAAAAAVTCTHTHARGCCVGGGGRAIRRRRSRLCSACRRGKAAGKIDPPPPGPRYPRPRRAYNTYDCVRGSPSSSSSSFLFPPYPILIFILLLRFVRDTPVWAHAHPCTSYKYKYIIVVFHTALIVYHSLPPRLSLRAFRQVLFRLPRAHETPPTALAHCTTASREKPVYN